MPIPSAPPHPSGIVACGGRTSIDASDEIVAVSRIRSHSGWSVQFYDRLAATDGFEIVTPPMWSHSTFRIVPPGQRPPAEIDAFNLALVAGINDDGRKDLIRTRVDGALVVRFQSGAPEPAPATSKRPIVTRLSNWHGTLAATS